LASGEWVRVLYGGGCVGNFLGFENRIPLYKLLPESEDINMLYNTLFENRLPGTILILGVRIAFELKSPRGTRS
jgi:hypothetical protein